MIAFVSHRQILVLYWKFLDTTTHLNRIKYVVTTCTYSWHTHKMEGQLWLAFTPYWWVRLSSSLNTSKPYSGCMCTPKIIRFRQHISEKQAFSCWKSNTLFFAARPCTVVISAILPVWFIRGCFEKSVDYFCISGTVRSTAKVFTILEIPDYLQIFIFYTPTS